MGEDALPVCLFLIHLAKEMLMVHYCFKVVFFIDAVRTPLIAAGRADKFSNSL